MHFNCNQRILATTKSRIIMTSHNQIQRLGPMRSSRIETLTVCLAFLVTTLSINSHSTTSASPSAGASASLISIKPSLDDGANLGSNQTLAQSATNANVDSLNRSTNKTASANGNHNGLSSIDPQSTELSSMYVQIPIAEPSDTNSPDSPVQQQTIGSNDAASSQPQDSKSWSGNWPKKFQIGYIKQSDLHQVLLESLKSEPFSTLANPSTGSTPTTGQTKTSANAASPTSSNGSTKTGAALTKTPASDSSSLMAGLSKAAPPVQWPQSISGSHNSQQVHHNRQQQHSAFKGPMSANHQPSMGPQGNNYFGRGFHSSMMPNYRFMNHQSPFHHANPNPFGQPPNIHMNLGPKPFQHHEHKPANFPMLAPLHQQHQQNHHHNHNHHHQQHQQQQQQQQFQFPSSMFKNQPIYTINNQFQVPNVPEQADINPMQIINGQLGETPSIPTPSSRPQKSTDFQSSLWKPVTSTEQSVSLNEAKSLAGVEHSQSSGLNDGFDDEFSSNSATGSKDSMNKHPALNDYLNGGNGNGNGNGNNSNSKDSNNSGSQASGKGGKLSPAMISRQQVSGSVSSNKSTLGAKSAGSQKSNFEPNSTKGAATKGGVDATSKRRGLPDAVSSTPSTSSTASTSEASAGADTGLPSGSTTESPSSSTSANPLSSSTTASSESETQEPESEVVETETNEPGSSSGADTTTANPQQQDNGAATTASSAAAETSQASSTRAASTPDNSEVELTNQTSASSGAGEGVSSTTALSSSREDTTPSSKTTEVEGAANAIGAAKASADSESPSDEALVAGLISKEINKANQQQQQQQQSSGKKTRSSDRLTSASTSGAASASAPNQSAPKRPSPNGNNVLVTKKPVVLASSKPNNGNSRRTGKNQSDSAKGSKLSAIRASKRDKSSRDSKPKPKARPKSTRMASGQIAQVVSMSASQAQSTAQTLASILLSRCMTSANCAHLLDVCSTKQGSVSLAALAGDSSATSDASSASLASSAAVGGSSTSTNSEADISSLSLGLGLRSSRQTAPSLDSPASGNWSRPVGLVSSVLMPLAQALQADRVLRVFPQWRESIENVMDQEAQTGYTLILPSNDAIDSLGPQTADSWLTNADTMAQIIESHILDSSEQFELYAQSNAAELPDKSARTRVIRSKGLQVNQHRDRMVTVNGKRMVYANQIAPAGGRIHVIDGILDLPSTSGQSLGLSAGSSAAKLLDIMDTLKQCDKFDGFVTLAEGTGLTQILKQDGPITVFVPSNEALRRIPDDELEVIKNNSTALREFLMYHVVNGSYFSQDLRDGQQIQSILNMKPIQVGVRVDGCSRRLVEANTSPMRRPDIVAKNGVIHILDWYLTLRDNDWCDPVARQSSAVSLVATASASNSTPQSVSRERLDQLGSEPGTSYATRLTMPANHKPSGAETTAE